MAGRENRPNMKKNRPERQKSYKNFDKKAPHFLFAIDLGPGKTNFYRIFSTAPINIRKVRETKRNRCGRADFFEGFPGRSI